MFPAHAVKDVFEGTSVVEILTIEPDLICAFRESFGLLTEPITGALVVRPDPWEPKTAGLMAELFSNCLAKTFRAWAYDEAMTPDEAVNYMAEDLRKLGSKLW